jgi:hypothetical protein
MEGYSGQLTVTYVSGATEILTLGSDGKAGFGAAYKDEIIRSLRLDNAASPTTILIGCKVADATPLSLKEDASGNPVLRDAVNGYTPIGSYAEFRLIATTANLSKKYKQEAPLDLMNETWAPIGTASPYFTGEYDGGEYEITNLKVSVTAANSGLFGYVNNSTLRNIRLVSGTVNGAGNVGGICGVAVGSTFITNAYSGVTVTGTGNQIGGICGQTQGTTIITSCRNTGNVKGTGGSNSNYIGGIAGYLNGTTIKIKDCDNRGEVEGNAYTGGIAGQSNATTAEITACRNSGGVKNTGSDMSGGIVGANNTSKTLTLTACYNIGAVNNNGSGNGTGGIIGYLYSGSTLVACYSTGTVTGTVAYTGLICGLNQATITSSYWTKGSSNVSKGVGTSGGTDPTQAFSATAWPSTSMSGWGIGDGQAANTYWKALGAWNSGTPEYPVLWWE